MNTRRPLNTLRRRTPAPTQHNSRRKITGGAERCSGSRGESTTPAQSDESATTDPDALFRQIHSDADRAVTLLNSPELPGRERVYLAYAYHLLALTQIELCQGANARQTLTWAADLYTETGHEALACESPALSRQTLAVPAEFRCRHQALSPGGVRNRGPRARSTCTPRHSQPPGMVGSFGNGPQRAAAVGGFEGRCWPKATPSPTRLFLRADLVFARVAVECGEFPDAEQLLCDARRLLCTVGAGPGDLCLIVYQILWARLALAKGDLGRADRCLQEIDLECDLFQHGYDCLEILAPDAACRQCVIQSCMHEFVCRRRCRRIRPCRVCFAVEEESMELVDVKAILKTVGPDNCVLASGSGWVRSILPKTRCTRLSNSFRLSSRPTRRPGSGLRSSWASRCKPKRPTPKRPPTNSTRLFGLIESFCLAGAPRGVPHQAIARRLARVSGRVRSGSASLHGSPSPQPVQQVPSRTTPFSRSGWASSSWLSRRRPVRRTRRSRSTASLRGSEWPEGSQSCKTPFIASTSGC